jgi:hypothetical protein
MRGMSRKVVKIRMPVKAREGENEQSHPFTEGLSSPAKVVVVRQEADPQAGAPTIGVPDEWVQGATAAAPPIESHEMAMPIRYSRLGDMTIDLTAEREFWQVSALILIVPPLLGWFWLWHSTNRTLNAFR